MRIDFYLLEDSAPDARWNLACRLLEKAYYRGHQAFVLTAHQEDARLLDERLWTFKDDAFIPHNLQGEGPEPPPPIQIGFGENPRGFDDILLNMSTEIPAFHHKFRRVIEIVAAEEAAKTIARQHFREYRALGYTLHTHEMAKHTTS